MSEPPRLDPAALFDLLEGHGIVHILVGSVAAMAYGVDLVPGDLDNVTRHGELDVVPVKAGRYHELLPRALALRAFGHEVRVAHVDHLLAQLDRWNRERDRVHRAGLIEARARLLAGATPPALESHPTWARSAP